MALNAKSSMMGKFLRLIITAVILLGFNFKVHAELVVESMVEYVFRLAVLIKMALELGGI